MFECREEATERVDFLGKDKLCTAHNDLPIRLIQLQPRAIRSLDMWWEVNLIVDRGDVVICREKADIRSWQVYDSKTNLTEMEPVVTAPVKLAMTLGFNAVIGVRGRSKSSWLLKNGHPKWCCVIVMISKFFVFERWGDG